MISSDLKKLGNKILKAKEPEEVFGKDITAAEFVGVFRELAGEVHPDRHQDDIKYFDAVLARLLTLRETAERKFAQGTYGRPTAVTLRTPKATYTLSNNAFSGDLCDVYGATSETGSPVMVKIARIPRDADLLAAEQTSLTELNTCDDFVKGKITSHEQGYWPTFVDHATIKIGTRVRPLNVISKVTQQHYTLQQVIDAYPDGLDMADASWMLRRLLEALYWTHKQDIVHGAVLPSNILITPEHHGLCLIDWCYSVHTKQKVVAAVIPQKDLYAPEILGMQPVTPAADVYMAAKVFQRVSKKKMPNSIRALLNACTLSHPKARITSAREAYDEINIHLLAAYSKPKFRHFKMPDNN